jgi:hypothetical protein
MDIYRYIYLVYFCFISFIVLFICWLHDKFTCIGNVCCVYIHICRRVRIHMHHRICGIDLSISFYIYLSVYLSVYLSIYLCALYKLLICYSSCVLFSQIIQTHVDHIWIG